MHRHRNAQAAGQASVYRHGCLRLLPAFLLCALLAGIPLAGSAGEDDALAAFVTAQLGADAGSHYLWLTPDLKEAARAETGKPLTGARQRYWRAGERTLWVLEHIGKEMPITFGIAVENERVVALQVLAYRETRGHEIRSARFLAQFDGAGANGTRLDRHVDGISGATLSVRASLAVARQALFLHRQAMQSP
jgi:hypothetical protein